MYRYKTFEYFYMFNSIIILTYFTCNLNEDQKYYVLKIQKWTLNFIRKYQ